MIFMNALLADTAPPATGYYVRQLAPGWPPAFHPMAATASGPEMIQIPILQLQLIGMVLGLAILCLAAVTLAIGRKTKTHKRS